LLSEYETTLGGLSQIEAHSRHAQFGPNTLQEHRRLNTFSLFLSQFRSPLILVLLFATIISAVTKDFIDALIILIIVLGSGMLSFLQEYNANNAVEKLRSQVQIKSRVFRDGMISEQPSETIVPGDILQLSAGSLIPADAVLLEATDFYINQAVLTGETFPVEKKVGLVSEQASLTERSNCVFMGTNVRSGTALALVVKIGKDTIFGEIADRLSVRPPETEFERGVRRFGLMLSRMMLMLVGLVFAINILFHKPFLDALLFSIALAVGITPELLPAIISVTLSKGSQEMARKGVIIRQLNAIENFGSMDILCTDKTGTLTEGIVQLDRALDTYGDPSGAVLRYSYLNAAYQTGLENPLDQAILKTDLVPDTTKILKIAEIPYDFVRKRMSVILDDDGQRLMITKGALDSVVHACTHIIEDGQRTITSSDLTRIEQLSTTWSGQGFRVLGMATKFLSDEVNFKRDDEQGLIFQGFLLFFDPPKEGAAQTIQSLAAMDINLKIISGDNRLVVTHLAESIGLPVTGIVSGSELLQTSDEALLNLVERANLFVEVDPNQKERLILSLQKLGHVVGYMGDGVNDAPSLRAADVGISVDQAVDVAKDAADFVLLEHDLDVLRQGILLGRSTFSNTLKYVYVTTSANFGNMFSMAGASLFLPFLPLLPLQILLTNFLTDIPALTIANDRVDPELIEEPRRWDIRHIQRFMLTFGFVSSAFDYLTFGVLYLLLRASMEVFRSGWFIESVISELLVMLVIRTRRSFFKSLIGRALLISTLLVGSITLILIYLPINRYLGLTSLPLNIILPLLAITVLYMITTEISKRVFYRREAKRE
jgi:Mg2+-importing ATPase